MVSRYLLCRLFLVFGLFCGYARTCCAQVPPAIQWENCYGTPETDYGFFIQQTADTGYMLSGRVYDTGGNVTTYYGNGDVWLAKLNTAGGIMWQKSYGGSQFDEGVGKQTRDGGYFIGGGTESTDGDVASNHGAGDVWAVKLDIAGNIVWQKTFGGDSLDEATSFQQTSDNGYIIAGFTKSSDGDVTNYKGSYDAWVIKLNDTGGLMWQKTLGGTGDDEAYAIQQTTDGGYMVGCLTNSTDGDVTGNHGSYDYWLVKLDDTGGIVWQKTYGGTAEDDLYGAQQTADGGYILAGGATSADGDVTANYGYFDVWLVKVDSTGHMMWQKNYGGSSGDLANGVRQTTDGGYIIGGYTVSSDGDVSGYHGEGDMWAVKTDSAGNLQWAEALGGSGNESALGVTQTIDGGFAFAGKATSTDGDVTGFMGGYGDIWAVKLYSPMLGVQPAKNPDATVKVYPTATSDGIVHVIMPARYENAQINMVNTLGQPITITTTGNALNRNVNIANVADGLYLLQVVNNGTIQSFKIICRQ